MTAWNFWRDEYLRLMYPDVSAETLSLLLDVSPAEIDAQAKKLGIKKKPAPSAPATKLETEKKPPKKRTPKPPPKKKAVVITKQEPRVLMDTPAP